MCYISDYHNTLLLCIVLFVPENTKKGYIFQKFQDPQSLVNTT